jgi:hypothetical protein
VSGDGVAGLDGRSSNLGQQGATPAKGVKETGAPQHSNGRRTVAAPAANPAQRPGTTTTAGRQPRRIHQLEEHVTLLQNRIRTLSGVITELSLEARASNVVALAPRRRHAT